jgi:two-component system, chemotaxis family, sensor kinase CheA
VSAAEWQKLSERAQLNTIFTPGLSTADHVTSISGRGVGMDVVRTNLQAIGGSIELENYEGHGLKMTLRLPLTLSIIAGLSVRAGDQIFGISRSSVVEILSSSNANVKIEELGGRRIASIRGERYPFATLDDVLEIASADASAAESKTFIVMRPAIGSTFVLAVASVIDNEELVVKPGAPLVMSTGLFAGTSLPDNGRPMLLLDASGLAAAIGVEMIEQADEGRRVDANMAGTIRNRPSALLYIANDGRKRAIRLSAIDRMEDVDAAQIQFIGGKMRVSVEGGLFDVCDIDSAPEVGLVKMLRLTDGQSIKYLVVEDVLDIFPIEGEIVASATPELHEGVIQAFGDQVELVNVFHYFEGLELRSGEGSSAALCYIDCDEDSNWERSILAPLLSASGYNVSFNPSDQALAAVVLHRDITRVSASASDPRALHLRDSSHAVDQMMPSIYRYDRVGLISAIEQKLARGA